MARMAGESIYLILPSLWAKPEFRALWALRWPKPCRMFHSRWSAILAGVLLTDQEQLASDRRRRFKKLRHYLYAAVVARDGEYCSACGARDLALRLDHILPLCWGGTNDGINLQLLCDRCNSRKGGRLPVTPEDRG